MSAETKWRQLDGGRVGWPGYTFKALHWGTRTEMVPSESGQGEVPVKVRAYRFQLWNNDGQLAHEMQLEVDEDTPDHALLTSMAQMAAEMRNTIEGSRDW